MSTFFFSSRRISAFALMLAFNSPPGLEIETRTSNVVALSFSLPSGEIFVTLPVNFLSLNDSTTMRAGWSIHFANVRLVDFAVHVNFTDVAERHDQGSLRPENEDRADRVSNIHVARK